MGYLIGHSAIRSLYDKRKQCQWAVVGLELCNKLKYFMIKYAGSSLGRDRASGVPPHTVENTIYGGRDFGGVVDKMT